MWSVGDIEFWVDFVNENSIKLQKMILQGKISWALFYTWANGTGYTSILGKDK
jgi:hypothetical protein